MPTIAVTDVPDETFERLRVLADRNQVSLAQEALRLLDVSLRAVDDAAGAAHAAALAELRRRRWTPPPGMPDSTALLREDRER